MTRALRFSILVAIAVQFSNCPPNSIRILIVNDWIKTATGVKYFGSNSQQLEQFNLDEPVTPGTARYVNIPNAAKGSTQFNIVLGDQSEFVIPSNLLSVGVGQTDVFYLASSPTAGWVKLAQ